MVHARLGVAAENSGKLVSTVRREAGCRNIIRGRTLRDDEHGIHDFLLVYRRCYSIPVPEE
jgi:hypothetical protein